MTDEELIKVLKEFETVRVEKLNDNSKRLFYAIMKIADERDNLKEENERLKKDYETIVSDNCDYLLLEKENQRLNNVLKRIKKYCVDNINSDSCTELTSCKITDVGYCIDALEDILDILKELKESDK